MTIFTPNGEISLKKGPSRQAQAMATRLAESASQQAASANPLALLVRTQAQLAASQLLMPEAVFALSHRFDLMSKGLTHVDGWNRIKHDPYTDQPEPGHFDWNELVGNVIAGLCVVAMVAIAAAVTVATFGAAGPVIAGAFYGACAIGGAVVVARGVSDWSSGNVSDTLTYLGIAFKGAAIGAVIGAGIAALGIVAPAKATAAASKEALFKAMGAKTLSGRLLGIAGAELIKVVPATAKLTLSFTAFKQVQKSLFGQD